MGVLSCKQAQCVKVACCDTNEAAWVPRCRSSCSQEEEEGKTQQCSWLRNTTTPWGGGVSFRWLLRQRLCSLAAQALVRAAGTETMQVVETMEMVEMTNLLRPCWYLFLGRPATTSTLLILTAGSFSQADADWLLWYLLLLHPLECTKRPQMMKKKIILAGTTINVSPVSLWTLSQMTEVKTKLNKWFCMYFYTWLCVTTPPALCWLHPLRPPY